MNQKKEDENGSAGNKGQPGEQSIRTQSNEAGGRPNDTVQDLREVHSPPNMRELWTRNSRCNREGANELRHGDISNRPAPYLGFDVDTIVYVPGKYLKRVAILEFLPFCGWFARKYYSLAPRCRYYLDNMMIINHNIMLFYLGPRSRWEFMQKLLDKKGVPYTSLNCVDSMQDLKKEVMNPDIKTYYSILPKKVQETAPKSVLFNDWDTFLTTKFIV